MKPSVTINIDDLIDLLKKLKYNVTAVTKSSFTIKTDIDRFNEIKKLLEILKKFGAEHVSDSRSTVGAIAINKIKIYVKPNSSAPRGIGAEHIAVAKLNDDILAAMSIYGKPITLDINNVRVHNVVKCEKTPGTVKSDFHFIDLNGKEVAWISYKLGSTAKHYQQYGGITEKKMVSKYHNDFDEMQDIVHSTLRTKYKVTNDVLPNAFSMCITGIPRDMGLMSMYGVDYGGAFGKNNVHAILQGDVGLIKGSSPGVYHLTATGNIKYNRYMPTGEYEPVLSVVYKGDRRQFELDGARVTIAPAGGRNYKEKVKNK